MTTTTSILAILENHKRVAINIAFLEEKTKHMDANQQGYLYYTNELDSQIKELEKIKKEIETAATKMPKSPEEILLNELNATLEDMKTQRDYSHQRTVKIQYAINELNTTLEDMKNQRDYFHQRTVEIQYTINEAKEAAKL